MRIHPRPGTTAALTGLFLCGVLAAPALAQQQPARHQKPAPHVPAQPHHPNVPQVAPHVNNGVNHNTRVVPVPVFVPQQVVPQQPAPQPYVVQQLPRITPQANPGLTNYNPLPLATAVSPFFAQTSVYTNPLYTPSALTGYPGLVNNALWNAQLGAYQNTLFGNSLWNNPLNAGNLWGNLLQPGINSLNPWLNQANTGLYNQANLGLYNNVWAGAGLNAGNGLLNGQNLGINPLGVQPLAGANPGTFLVNGVNIGVPALAGIP